VAILEVEGTRIAYDEQGKDTGGPNVVFVHGFPLNRLMWEPQMDALRGSCHVVAPDMRGFGASEVPTGTISMRRMADDVDALVTTLELEPIVLVGLSMGGYVALEYLRNYGPKVRALVLADTRAAGDSAEARTGRSQMIQKVASEGPAAIAEEMLPKLLSPGTIQGDEELVVRARRMIETTSAAGIAAALAGMAERANSTDLLGSIAVPTLVVVGSEDTVTPRDEAAAMAASIPGARLAVVEGAGHLSNLERPEEFNKELRAFLDDLTSGA
jgi:pimeloyl-ACP methyl ester carboxylesterase